MKTVLTFTLASLVTMHAWADGEPQNNCKQPSLPNPQASDIVVKYFNKHMTEYKNCLNTFIDQQQAVSKNSTDVTKANIAHDAAEKAIKEYNDFMELLKERDRAAGKEVDEEEDSNK